MALFTRSLVMLDVTEILPDLLLTWTICLHLLKQISPFIVHHSTSIYSKSATFWSFRLITTNPALFGPS